MSIQFKRSAADGRAPDPDHLDQGELAINMTDLKLYTKNHADQIINIGFSQDYADANFLRVSGGLITGRLQLAEGTLPASSGIDDVVSKRYVDAQFGPQATRVRTNAQSDATYVSMSGDTMTGPLVLPGTPTADRHATTKEYVDSGFVKKTTDVMSGTLSVATPTQSAHATTKQFVEDYVTNAIATAISEAMQKSHAIGSYYVTEDATNPSSILGFGTWEQVRDRFLVGAGSSYVVSAEGGQSTVQLTTTQIPSHNHSVNIATTSSGNHAHPYDDVYFSEARSGTQQNVYGSGDSDHDNEFWTTRRNTLSAGSHTHRVTGNTGNSGGSQAHENRPPYRAVYMWRRTA